MTAFDLLRQHASSGVRRRDDAGRVWELAGSGGKVEALRDRLLAQLLRDGAVLAYDEEAPDDARLRDCVTIESRGRFRIAPGAPVAALRAWLAAGNWQLASADVPSSSIDLVRADAADVVAFVDAHGLAFVVDSFHDDDPRVVGLARPEPSPDLPPISGPVSAR